MRILFRCSVWAASALLALMMLAINQAFEAAGSVPDIPDCGFLAANPFALLFLYPLCAGFLAGKLARYWSWRASEEAGRIVRAGGRIGLYGGAIYFGLGFLLLRSASTESLAVGGIFALGYTFLCWIGGRLGALGAVHPMRMLAWRVGRG